MSGYAAVNAWDLVKRQLELRLSSESFQNWLNHAVFSRIDHRTLWVEVPNAETKTWLASEYGEVIHGILKSLDSGIESVAYEVVSGKPDSGPRDVELEPVFADLNPKFTFESFVVGSCNQFAHAAAKSVATSPSRRYNPLFIYGGVGMGKTHLMHAVGRSLVDNFAGMKIIYTSSEKFMNEMITSIRLDRMPQFHSFYRSADALLVDDIHILGGKERTQEEFFHTFNELYDHQKQIIISSDSTPKEIPGLVERLRSRFEWGLMVDIQPPDLETKMAILDKKAASEGIRLPDDVRSFIASRTKSNVRELEGALVKLIAFSSITNSPITLQMTQQVLKHLVHVQDRRVTIDSIQKAVADSFGLRQPQLREKSNTKAIAYPRQIAMYLVKELTLASLPEIGRAFGGKHHTTVLHSIHKIEQLRHTDPDLNRLIHKLMDSLQ
ncbi:MAG: chromosomal replication initiator protein DnaA [Acidobacteria bacterium]|nr:chromosomal replication initiator protein DnaA [Acidobacteriota bacterium]